MKTILPLLIFALLILGCGDSEKISRENDLLKQQVSELKEKINRMDESYNKLMFLAGKLDGVTATIKTNKGDIELEFFPADAPIQTFNFVTRAECGYYDGTLFHRVIPGFMIQGGDPNTKTDNVASYGSGGPIVNVPNEFNERQHKRGILSTARTSDPNAGAGSQFFIMHQDYPSLDGQYTVFGRVTKGMEVVDAIATTKTTQNDRPTEPVRILTIEVTR